MCACHGATGQRLPLTLSLYTTMAANGAQLPPPPPPPPPVDWEEALYDALRPAPKRIANTPNVTDTPEPFSALLSDERRVRASQDGAARVDLVKILGSLAVMDVCPGTEVCCVKPVHRRRCAFVVSTWLMTSADDRATPRHNESHMISMTARQ